MQPTSAPGGGSPAGAGKDIAKDLGAGGAGSKPTHPAKAAKAVKAAKPLKAPKPDKPAKGGNATAPSAKPNCAKDPKATGCTPKRD